MTEEEMPENLMSINAHWYDFLATVFGPSEDPRFAWQIDNKAESIFLNVAKR